MNFDEMQVIWDSQNERTMYALDTGALHESIRRRGRKLGWTVTFEEFTLALICLFVGAKQAWDPLMEGKDHHQYAGAVLFVGVAIYTLVGRVQRLKRERAFSSTMLGELERAIFRIACQVRRARTFVWWFLLPAAVTVALSLLDSDDSKPSWQWVIVLGAFFLGQWVVRLGLRCQHLPAKSELEALRAKLLQEV